MTKKCEGENLGDAVNIITFLVIIKNLGFDATDIIIHFEVAFISMIIVFLTIMDFGDDIIVMMLGLGTSFGTSML